MNVDLNDGRTPSGVKVVGLYTYTLLLDTSNKPEHLIKRALTDGTEVKWYKVPYGNAFTTPWGDVTSVSYVWATEVVFATS